MSEKDINNNSEEKNLHRVEKSKKKHGFINRLEAVLVDELMIGAAAYILLLIFDLILRYACGLYVTDMVPMYLIFFVIVSVLYPLIMESTKLRNTIGRKISGLELVCEDTEK